MIWLAKHTAEVKQLLGFGTAGVSGAATMLADLGSTGLPTWVVRLLDYGMAGIFILALLYAVKITREDVSKKEGRIADLEKEIRDGLRLDLQAANESRAEMIRLLKKSDTREEKKTH